MTCSTACTPAGAGRSVPPETLLKATVLMAMYSIRSERAFCERLNYDLLFKWFLDMRIDAAGVRRDDVHQEPPASPGPRGRGRVLRRGGAPGQAAPLHLERPLLRRRDPVGGVGVAQELQAQRRPAVGPARRAATPRCSGTGERRSNDTHASTTDPEARLYRKSNNTAATLCYSGHLLMENRNALIVDAELTTADGYAERATALEMLARLPNDRPATHRRRRQGLRHPRVRRRRPRARVHAARRARTPPGNDPRSTGARPATPATRSACGSANGSRNPSAGSRPSAAAASSATSAEQRNRAWFKITAAVYNLIRITALDAEPPEGRNR